MDLQKGGGKDTFTWGHGRTDRKPTCVQSVDAKAGRTVNGAGTVPPLHQVTIGPSSYLSNFRPTLVNSILFHYIFHFRRTFQVGSRFLHLEPYTQHFRPNFSSKGDLCRRPDKRVSKRLDLYVLISAKGHIPTSTMAFASTYSSELQLPKPQGGGSNLAETFVPAYFPGPAEPDVRTKPQGGVRSSGDAGDITLQKLKDECIINEGTHNMDLMEWVRSVYVLKGKHYRTGSGHGVNDCWSLEDVKQHAESTSLADGLQFDADAIPPFDSVAEFVATWREATSQPDAICWWPPQRVGFHMIMEVMLHHATPGTCAVVRNRRPAHQT